MKKVTKDFIRIFEDENWFMHRFDGRKRVFRGIDKAEWFNATSKAYYRRRARDIFALGDSWNSISKIRRAYFLVCKYSRPELGRYQKVAICGRSHLFLCSPEYGLRDYNKSAIYMIKGHEKECKWLIEVSQRIANKLTK